MVNVEEIKHYVNKIFSDFGVNRKQEIIRLLFEISKKENKKIDDIIKDAPIQDRQFLPLKQYLMKRRFPNLIAQEKKVNFSLPELDINPKYRINIRKKFQIIPRHFYIEKSVLGTALAKRLKTKFPDAQFTTITRYKEFVGKKKWGIEDYNHRAEQFFVVKEGFDFFKKCPCSIKSVSCGYHVINLGSGCAFECTYCYLQDYINSPGIVIPANIEDFFRHFEYYKQDIRLGSGELTDSLLFDHITEFSPLIVDFFRKYPRSTFEFKTKSNNIDLLLSVKSAGNIVVAWSINPQRIIETTEFYTASLEERLQAAEQCARAGYKVAFHFDPIIYCQNWETDYHDLVNEIFTRIDDRQMAWLSLGTLRMTPRLKKIIENRFPENKILDEEFIPAYDGKMRYSHQIRSNIYKKMKEWIKSRSPNVYFYLCMEEKLMCQENQTPPLRAYDKVPV